jgi:hypothetical protein
MMAGRMNKIRAGGMIAASTAAIMLLLPGAAHADGSKRTTVNKTALGTRAVGKVWFYDKLGSLSQGGWDLKITDASKGKWCAEAEITFDIAWAADHHWRSKRACGAGKSVRFADSRTWTYKHFRSVKVQLCQVEKSGAHRTCKTAQTVKNPYY